MTMHQATSEIDYSRDAGKLLAMQIMLCSRMDEVFTELGISLLRTNKMYVGPCPVHGGDNVGAMNIYFGGESVPGFWRCQSRHCEQTFKRTIIGFIRGVLSRKEYGWHGPNTTNTVSFKKTIDWCCKFLGVSFNNLKVDEAELEQRQYISHIASVVKTIEQRKGSVTRQRAISALNIPGQYFINRGWSAEVLERYDVGTPRNPNSILRGRTVVPIYDDTASYLIGSTARSLFERCGKCRLWHDPTWAECPRGEYANRDYCKWRNEGLQRESVLYNYWYAKGYIKRTSTVILVEGPGDLWRLVESGINIGVAMLGTSLSDQQQVILEMSGAMNVILCTNNDEAGRLSAAKIREQLGRSFKIYTPTIPTNDLGELPPAKVREILVPLLERICR